MGKDTYHFLEQANVNSEQISKKYLLYVLFGFFVNTFIMSGVSVIICHIFFGKFDPKYVYHPFRTLWVSDFSSLKTYLKPKILFQTTVEFNDSNGILLRNLFRRIYGWCIFICEWNDAFALYFHLFASCGICKAIFTFVA